MLTVVILVVGALAVVIFLICRNAQRNSSSPHANRCHAADALPFILMANAADTTRHGGCDGSAGTQIEGGDAGASAGSSASDCGGGSDGGGGGCD